MSDGRCLRACRRSPRERAWTGRSSALIRWSRWDYDEDKWLTLHLSGLSHAHHGHRDVTPDSFSDGGRYFDSRSALAHALGLIEKAQTFWTWRREFPARLRSVSLDEELRRVCQSFEPSREPAMCPSH